MRYYIVHPNGRERINARTDAEAVRLFRRHWTATASWSVAGERRLESWAEARVLERERLTPARDA